jgi:CBS domain-containing protein
VGTLTSWEARELDPGLAVGSVMRRAERVLDALSPLSDAVAILHETDTAFVPVLSGGDVHGAITPQSLRRAGIRVEQSPCDLGGSD